MEIENINISLIFYAAFRNQACEDKFQELIKEVNLSSDVMIGGKLYNANFTSTIIKLDFPNFNSDRKRKNNIEQPLKKYVFRRRIVTFETEHREMEHMDMTRAAHQNVADSRDDEDRDFLLDTVFDDFIPVAAVDAGEKDGFSRIENRKTAQARF